MRWMAALAVLVGCKTVTTDAIQDAAPDTRPIDAAINERLTPFTASGNTPAGSLDDVRYISVGFYNGFCQPGYYIGLYRTNLESDRGLVRFQVLVPFDTTEPPTGTLPVTAYLAGATEPSTAQVTFDILQYDIPPTKPLRIAGRMFANTANWQLDFPLDAQVADAGTCL